MTVDLGVGCKLLGRPCYLFCIPARQLAILAEVELSHRSHTRSHIHDWKLKSVKTLQRIGFLPIYGVRLHSVGRVLSHLVQSTVGCSACEVRLCRQVRSLPSKLQRSIRTMSIEQLRAKVLERGAHGIKGLGR